MLFGSYLGFNSWRCDIGRIFVVYLPFSHLSPFHELDGVDCGCSGVQNDVVVAAVVVAVAAVVVAVAVVVVVVVPALNNHQNLQTCEAPTLNLDKMYPTFFQNKLLTPISNPISPSLQGSSCDDPVKLTKRKIYEVGLVERISGIF